MDGNYQLIVGKRMDTGKKWIDPASGRAFPVYKKLIDVGALPNATTKTVALGNDAQGNAEVVDVAKYAGVSAFWATNGTVVMMWNLDLTIQLTTSSVQLISGTNLSSFTQGYVEVEFCDTTDEGS